MTLKNTDNALIKIKNRQTDDGRNDIIETEYSGRFYENNGKFYIMYREDSGVSCMIKIDKDVITVNRKGDASSVMICKKGTVHNFLYHTQYGAIQMSVSTSEIFTELDGKGGKIVLKYILGVNGGNIENDMEIIAKCNI